MADSLSTTNIIDPEKGVDHTVVTTNEVKYYNMFIVYVIFYYLRPYRYPLLGQRIVLESGDYIRETIDFSAMEGFVYQYNLNNTVSFICSNNQSFLSLICFKYYERETILK